MKRLISAAAILVASATGALAAQKVANVEVSGLYCASCPYIAAQAIQGVDSAKITGGVYDARKQIAQFAIQYDDEKANLQQILNATEEIGYPSRRIERVDG